MNNKGFAIMSLIYGLVVVAGLILFGTLTIMNISSSDNITNTDKVEEELIYCFATYNKGTKTCSFGQETTD